MHDSLGVHTCVQVHKPVPWGSADPGVGGIRPPTFRSQLYHPLLTPPDHLQMLTGLPHGLSPPIIASGFLFGGLRGTCGVIRTFILICSVSPQGLVLFPVGSPVTEQGLALLRFELSMGFLLGGSGNSDPVSDLCGCQSFVFFGAGDQGRASSVRRGCTPAHEQPWKQLSGRH